jgi:hypothetical protein
LTFVDLILCSLGEWAGPGSGRQLSLQVSAALAGLHNYLLSETACIHRCLKMTTNRSFTAADDDVPFRLRKIRLQNFADGFCLESPGVSKRLEKAAKGVIAMLTLSTDPLARLSPRQAKVGGALLYAPGSINKGRKKATSQAGYCPLSKTIPKGY